MVGHYGLKVLYSDKNEHRFVSDGPPGLGENIFSADLAHNLISNLMSCGRPGAISFRHPVHRKKLYFLFGLSVRCMYDDHTNNSVTWPQRFLVGHECKSMVKTHFTNPAKIIKFGTEVH